jgi:membrane protease YdiL (CAAX protease family)
VRIDPSHPRPSWHGWRVPLAVLAAALAAALVREPQPVLASLIVAAVAAVLTALTLRFTASPALTAPPGQRGRATLQLACALAFYLCGILDAARVFDLVALPAFAPLEAFEAFVGRHGVNPRWVVNPILGGVLPAAAMLLLGATRRELGLQLGRHSVRAALIWCTLPAALLVQALASGAVSLGWLGWNSVDMALQAAIGEELFDRGVVQSRLERFGAGWAVVGSAILFGLEHVPVQLHLGAPDLGSAIARCMIQQTTMGLAFALLFWRTRSVLPSMALHVLVNVIGSLPG